MTASSSQIYQKMNLTDVEKGVSRVMESSCKECRGQGVINKLEQASARSPASIIETIGLTVPVRRR